MRIIYIEMKKLYPFAAIFLCTVFFCSCKNTSDRNSDNFLSRRAMGMPKHVAELSSDGFLTDTIDIYGNISDNMPVSQLISDIRYLRLEKTRSSVFSTIKDIKCNSRYLFVFDRDSRLKQFDINTGKYISNVFSRGEGPEEVINPSCFDVDENYVYILDGRRAGILVYDMSGDFVRRMDVPFRADHFRRRDDGTYVFKLSPFNGSYPSLDNYTVVVTDSAFIPKSKYLYKDTKDVSVRIDRTPFFSPSGNYFGFTAIYGNTYYGLTADGIYRPMYFFDLGDKTVPEYLLEESDKNFIDFIRENDKAAVLYAPTIEGRKHLIFRIDLAYYKNKGLFVYSKDGKEGVLIKSFDIDRRDMLFMPQIMAYNSITGEFVGVQNLLATENLPTEEAKALKEHLGAELYSKLTGSDPSDIVISFVRFKS